MHLLPIELRTVNVTRYVTPLREGGSMPAIAEADDGFLYVVKFRGAGQGPKALIAELIGGEIARALGLKIPELVFVNLDEAFGRTEADEEIQDLLKASTGLNLALHYLSSAISFDPSVSKVDAHTASKIVWLDAFLMNMDRTVRNTNMLLWRNDLWLIDHGAALYFHHAGSSWEHKATATFEMIKNHVLLQDATELAAVDQLAKSCLSNSFINELVNIIPAAWLAADLIYPSIEEQRNAYANYLINRLSHSNIFIEEVAHAQ